MAKGLAVGVRRHHHRAVHRRHREVVDVIQEYRRRRRAGALKLAAWFALASFIAGMGAYGLVQLGKAIAQAAATW